MTQMKKKNGLLGIQAFSESSGIQDVHHEYRHQNPVLKGQHQPGSVPSGKHTPTQQVSKPA